MVLTQVKMEQEAEPQIFTRELKDCEKSLSSTILLRTSQCSINSRSCLSGLPNFIDKYSQEQTTILQIVIPETTEVDSLFHHLSKVLHVQVLL